MGEMMQILHDQQVFQLAREKVQLNYPAENLVNERNWTFSNPLCVPTRLKASPETDVLARYFIKINQILQ